MVEAAEHTKEIERDRIIIRKDKMNSQRWGRKRKKRYPTPTTRLKKKSVRKIIKTDYWSIVFLSLFPFSNNSSRLNLPFNTSRP